MFLKLRGPYRLKCIRCDEDEQQNCAIRLRGCSDNQLTPCSYRSQTLKPLGAYTFRFFLSFVNVRIRKPKIINLHLTPKRPQIFKTHRKIIDREWTNLRPEIIWHIYILSRSCLAESSIYCHHGTLVYSPFVKSECTGGHNITPALCLMDDC